jgi:DNA repair protein RecO (recombination protein O)
MLEIKDVGIIISSTPFQEKFLIIRCFSKNHGVIAGLIRVNKKKNDAIVGNIVLFSWKAKLSGQLGYLNVEVLHPILPQIMFESNKVTILNATIHMLKIVLKEREANSAAFTETYSLLQNICSIDDVSENYKAYINFEAKLLNSCGYGLDWSKCAVTDSRENIMYISPKTGNAVTEEVGKKYKNNLFELPKFLMDATRTACAKDIISALNILGYFIEKHLFTPYQLKLPKVRSLMIRDIDDSQKSY